MDPKADPNDAEYAKNLGNARKAAEDLEGAIASYRRSLEIAPDYVPALYNLGLVLHSLNRLEEAEGFFRRVLQIDPRDVEAFIHLGAVLQKRAQFPAAAAAYRSALRVKPDDPILWMLLGIASRESASALDESIRALRKCTELKADFAEGHYELALAYKRQGRTDEAVDSYRRALALDDGISGAHYDLADILQAEGRLEEAVDHYHHALRSSPDYAAAYSSLACALVRQNRLDEAADLFSKALQLQPDLADAHFNFGSLHSLRGARDEALRCYLTAARLRPGDAAIRECVLREKQHTCDWPGIGELIALQRRAVAEGTQTISPFSLLSIPSTRAEQLACARQFAARQSLAMARERERTAFRFERGARERLRIGYLSADLHEHATAHWMAELFELHERSRFEIIAYSYGPDDASPMRARLKRAFDRFVDIGSLSHADAAAAIHRDRVDILVDLKGYTMHSRPGIVALRPAPVQVSFVGYPGTMGAPFIDFLIGDRFVTPPEHAADYSEKLVRVPGSYQVNDRKRIVGATPSRRELGLPGEGFVFCCFNQTYKILPGTFDIWMRLLAARPGSVLWLLESNPWAAANLRREAQARGIDPRRLLFAPLLPLGQHLGRMRAADLLLDTLPYNAHTISSDALWAGLPVLTCPGDTFVARVAGSQLTAMRVPELITHSIAEYEAMALSLASAPAVLGALREKLTRHRTSAALFDTPSFARSLEEAFQRMWAQHVAGDAPQAIDI
jgi:predicted O-linked N-acetylglucosamine transferase (SPINDLY family)